METGRQGPPGLGGQPCEAALRGIPGPMDGPRYISFYLCSGYIVYRDLRKQVAKAPLGLGGQPCEAYAVARSWSPRSLSWDSLARRTLARADPCEGSGGRRVGSPRLCGAAGHKVVAKMPWGITGRRCVHNFRPKRTPRHPGRGEWGGPTLSPWVSARARIRLGGVATLYVLGRLLIQLCMHSHLRMATC